jgi:hypothetical protein
MTHTDYQTKLRQALARGYCHPDNSNKEVDAVLIEAMAQEVEEMAKQTYYAAKNPN